MAYNKKNTTDKRDNKRSNDKKSFDKPYKKKDYKRSSEASSEDKHKKRDFKKPYDKNFKKKDYKKKDEIKTDEIPVVTEKRLNKYIANAGICSRREADKLIEEGHVTINNKKVTEMGFKVGRKDKVKVKGKLIHAEKSVYILLNKPKGVLTTDSDNKGRKTVLDFFKGKLSERIYPIGRLDKDTTGVLLLTNDGDLTKKLAQPKKKKKKIYHVFLDKDIQKEDMEKIIAGAELEDGFMKFGSIEFPNPEHRNEVGIDMHSGKNRIIRRMFAHFGFEVIKLDRVYFEGLTKKDVKRGKWRHLTEREVSNLKRGTYE
ncbi:MAG: rRNA pseudouridine synthase [Bacteroidales bacterium]|nr:rRNA pseudouridine synthase [Bacteroidales bacterium]